MHGIEARLFDRPLAIHPSYARALASYGTRTSGIQNIVYAEGETRIELRDGPAQETFFEFMFGGRDQDDYVLRDGIATIPVRGCLSQRSYWRGSYETIGETLRSALSNSEVKAILFDIDSPGGDVAGLFDLADEIYEARGEKPIWAMASELAASAAYAIGSAADRFFLPRTGEVGSVGVLMLHCDEAGALEKYGITITPIYSGSHKVDGAWYQALSEPAKARFQSEVSDTYELFVNTVARNRDMSVEAVRGTEALTYRGQRAVEAGLADEVMAMRDVFEALRAEVTGSPDADPAATPAKRSKAMKTTTATTGRRPAARTAKQTPKPKAEDPKTPDTEDAADEEGDVDAIENEDDVDAVDDEDDVDAADDTDTTEEKSASGERKRIAAILGSKEANGKSKLANHIALNTSLSVKAAKSMLASAADEKAGGGLSGRMSGVDPKIGTPVSAATDERVAFATACYADRRGLKR